MATDGKVGRPSDYKPEYCELVSEFLADGYSVAAFAGSIPVAKSTVYKWMDEHPEFSDAVKVGQARAVLWWEDANRHLATKGEGNATANVFGLKNRAADEWRDKQEIDHQSSDGTMKPTTINIVGKPIPERDGN